MKAYMELNAFMGRIQRPKLDIKIHLATESEGFRKKFQCDL